jgi:6-phosphogluconolactonase (cycloisomerase 2 family)
MTRLTTCNILKEHLTIILLFLSNIVVVAQDFYLFVGTYTDAKPDKGIYIYGFDSKTGNLNALGHAENTINPSYINLSPNGKYLYACTETQMSENGNISAFRFDKKTAKLTLLNKVSSGGDNPCFVMVHPSGKWLVNANYSGGNGAATKIKKDGSLEGLPQVVQFSGSSVIKGRQDEAHIHASMFTPDNKFVFFPDLGSDKIWGYSFNPSAVKPLQKAPSPETTPVPGSGPRHLAFHPTKKFAYCIEELSGMVSAYTYSEGTLTSIQRIAAHESTVEGPFGSADIHLSPDGKFLYASNRAKENTIAIFSLQPDGMLKWVGVQSTLGTHPRNFIIDPTGRFLLVANQHTNNIVVFKRDANSGLITPAGIEISVPRPSCLQMMKM